MCRATEIARTVLLLASAVWLTFAPHASAYPERPIHVAVMGGVRSFENRLDLEPDAAFGLRVGLGLDRRVSVLVDYIHTAPARKTTGKAARISGLRGLVQCRLLSGPVRPYVLLGIGGLLFDFDDTYDTAAGSVAGGGGVEVRVDRHVHLFGEASVDFYRYRNVLYSTTGSELSSSMRSTDNVTAFVAGIKGTF